MQENVSLAKFTTFKLGGRARFFVAIHSVQELEEALVFAEAHNLQTLILGGGSNLLVQDAGFDGLVIKIELRGIEVADTGADMVEVAAAAGEGWDELVAYTTARGLWGLENLSGIPGTVGAAPVQNIGAYGADIAQTCVRVDVYDTQEKKLATLSTKQCGFGYRDSIFKQAILAGTQRYIIVRVVFALSKNAAPNIVYKDLAEAFAENTPTKPDTVRTAVLSIRAGKFPDLAQEGTAGSFFMNPIISPRAAETLHTTYPDMPQYPAVGGTKVSLAWILDHVLAAKGMSVGGARLYEKQPLVVATNSTATAQDVIELQEKIVALVKEKVGIDVEIEVRII
jgi:UDP-N-acetylmuramate dehydrogenase